MVMLENSGIFPGLHGQAKFGVIVFRNSGTTEELKGKFVRGTTDIFRSIEQEAITIPSKVLAEFSPEAKSFPYVDSKEQVDVLDKIVQFPSLSKSIGDSWYVHPYSELHSAQDTDRYIENKEKADYPVFGGRNVYQYTYTPDFISDIDSPELWSVDEDKDPELSAKRRIREKCFRSTDPEVSPKKAIYTKFDGSGSQKGFVNDLLNEGRGEPLDLEDVLLDCTEYRLAFRKITQSTNERTIICSVLPRDVVSHEALPTIRPYTIDPEESDLSNYPLHSAYERSFTDEELFLVCGFLNSLPFDYLMRAKTEENVVNYKLEEAQVPKLTDSDEWFDYISHRAARLNCYGEQFAEMRERLGDIEPATDEEARIELHAEIDAAAFHAYGLDRDETEFVLDDFCQVRNPRMMTDEYFDLVLAKYDDLSE